MAETQRKATSKTDFASVLFDGADVGESGIADRGTLSRLADQVFDFFTERAPGSQKLHLYDIEAQDGESTLTVIEAINDDMPFLVSSVLAEIVDFGLNVHFASHPIFRVQRDPQGRLKSFTEAANGKPSDGAAESLIHIWIDAITDESLRRELEQRIGHVLDQVRIVVGDWQAMLSKLRSVIDGYVTMPPPVAGDELAESVQFLKWMAEGNFTFLGTRQYDFSIENGAPRLRIAPDTSLGLLRDPNLRILRRTRSEQEMAPIAEEFYSAEAPLIIATANFMSPVQRRVPINSIGIKLFSADGRLTGELRIVGLFSSTAYNQPVSEIPFLRLKADRVMRTLGHSQSSHSGRVVRNIIETFPRDELFQVSTDQLVEICRKLVRLELMPSTCVVVRYDEFGRYASALIYIRRDRFTTEVRERVIALLERRFDARMTNFTPLFSFGPLVRLHVVIWKDEGQFEPIPETDLEQDINRIVHTWRDDLAQLIRSSFGRKASAIAHRYSTAFPPGYEHSNDPARAITDIEKIEQLDAQNPVAIDFFEEEAAAGSRLHAMLYQLDEPIRLSRRVPVLENLGFSVISEETFKIRVLQGEGKRSVFLHKLLLEPINGHPVDIAVLKARLEDCFIAVWRNDARNDRFNRLIAAAGLNWREAALMRAYSAFLRQIGAPYGLDYIAQTLVRHAGIVRDLTLMFHETFDPSRNTPADLRAANAYPAAQRIERALDGVSSLDEDRILRHILNLIQSTLRTNFYQPPSELAGGASIALKIKSERVDGIPSPKPYAEIFVTSPRFEGVHLRGGPIARGGLRWSDRPQDFRTEILGLAKAQQVKNSIIVPQGAKGGFVPRALPPVANREAFMAEGIACYRSFIANLLSVTDNLKDKSAVHPEHTVCLDGDDPYLVVAADKGTATFSDIANELAVSRGFWLGDAFASGGSAGYDHKKMGITARGAWEAVKRHFREMNVDTQTMPFTVIGVGDMSGDVFGNGMLLSRQIRLLAAFDHRDIFIDPDPDPETSWQERKRLFDLPRSSWQDYDRKLISEGGGVFSRSSKSVPLSEQIQGLLGVTRDRASPSELIRLILMAEADLLWFGGIGTYVRASHETNENANDRANDAIRITARDLRVKVIGEGANLGLTQSARIEFDMAGGRINTDAIDNSAGVNSSDMEVNIKIALANAMRSGVISLEDRNAILVAMTDEVAEAVLKNNYLQTLAVSLGRKRGLSDIEFQNRLMAALEKTSGLDRELEKLPGNAEIGARIERRQPLTRPELSALLAYSKIALYSELIDSAILDDPYLSRVLAEYFPRSMRERFCGEIETHALRREIIATMLSNEIINRGGSTFTVRLKEQTGRDARSVAFAFAAVMGAFRLSEFFAQIDALDGKVDGQRQLSLYMLVQDILRHQTAWFMRHGDFSAGLSSLISRYRDGIDRLAASIEEIFDEALLGRLAELQRSILDMEISEDVARRFAVLKALGDGPDIILLAERLERPETDIAKLYFEISSYFRIDEMRARIETQDQPDYYNRTAVMSTLNAATSALRMILEDIFASGAADAGGFKAWRADRESGVRRTRSGIDEVLDSRELTLAKLTVAIAQLRELAESS